MPCQNDAGLSVYHEDGTLDKTKYHVARMFQWDRGFEVSDDTAKTYIYYPLANNVRWKLIK